jgi:hypothetical protein
MTSNIKLETLSLYASVAIILRINYFYCSKINFLELKSNLSYPTQNYLFYCSKIMF